MSEIHEISTELLREAVMSCQGPTMAGGDNRREASILKTENGYIVRSWTPKGERVLISHTEEGAFDAAKELLK